MIMKITALHFILIVMQNDEILDIRCDISKNAELVEVITGKKNRTIIYPSWYWHGAYMEDHSEWVENGDTVKYTSIE